MSRVVREERIGNPPGGVRRRSPWSPEDISWGEFDSTKVDPDILKAIKGACMVEHHSDDYVTYLCSVFHDDEAFQSEARAWGVEEVQHGIVLRRWCELADPDFDFNHSFRQFTAGHILPLDSSRSVRGSRTKELIARCIVEVGTRSFYSAIRDASDEPVLQDICRRIAGDEFRHYKLFYANMKRYRTREALGFFSGLVVALTRLLEGSDDELAYAYYCGNRPPEPYKRRYHGRAYARRTLPLYQRAHVERAIMMTLKAAGLRPQSILGRWLTHAGGLVFRLNAWSLTLARS